MERASVRSFIEEIFENINHEAFTPGRVDDVSDLLKEIFYKETPYWVAGPSDAPSNKCNFCIEFKKYNQYGKTVYLLFKFNGQRWDSQISRNLILSLVGKSFTSLDEEESLELVEVWKDQDKFYQAFLRKVENGLNITEEDKDD